MKRQRAEHNGGNGALQNDLPSSKRGMQQHQRGEGQCWSEADHRDFVAAIFEIGLKHSSPSALLEHMVENEDLTVERVKSRLQKFRLKREESRAEFMSSYDETMARYKSDEAVSGTVPTYGGVRNQSAEPAAFLTRATIAEGSGQPLPFNPEPHGNGAAGAASSSVVGRNSAASATSMQRYGRKIPVTALSGSVAASMIEQGEVGGAPLRLPELTEDELHTPIGQSFSHLMGLFASLKDNLLQQRAEAAAAIDGDDGASVDAAEANNCVANEIDMTAAAAAAAAAAVATAATSATVCAANGDSNGGSARNDG